MIPIRGYETKEIGEYYAWLIGYFGFSDDEICHYEELLHQLFITEFKCVLEKDLNRVSYGLLFRDEFYESTGIDISDSMWSCSVLEVLMGLSKSIAESVLGDLDDQNLKKSWLFTWLRNLGLLDILRKNGDYNRLDVCIILQIWMNRDFQADGNGSPFPLRRPTCDQRSAEMWKQAMLYLSENDPENEY